MKEGFSFTPAAAPEGRKPVAPVPEDVQNVLEALKKQQETREPTEPRIDEFALQQVLEDLGF